MIKAENPLLGRVGLLTEGGFISVVYGYDPSTRAIPAAVKHQSSGNQHKRTAHNFEQEEVRIIAVFGRHYRCADCQKGRCKPDPLTNQHTTVPPGINVMPALLPAVRPRRVGSAAKI